MREVPITAQKSNFPRSPTLTARSFLCGCQAGLIWMPSKQPNALRPLSARTSPSVLSAEPVTGDAARAAQNLLLVTLHGLRADMLTPEVMPINLFANQHDRNQHFAGDNDTDSSLFSLFYGLPASYMGDALADKRAPLLMDGSDRDYRISTFSSPSKISRCIRQACSSGLHKAPLPASIKTATINRYNSYRAGLVSNRAVLVLGLSGCRWRHRAI